MADIKIGTVVRLNSGGPLMTVEEVMKLTRKSGDIDGVACYWFHNDESYPSRHVFPVEALKVEIKE
jgi:uncharacterized protein YodC (DUF2158 family)